MNNKEVIYRNMEDLWSFLAGLAEENKLLRRDIKVLTKATNELVNQKIKKI